MLKIRLQRIGRKHEPVFRLVVVDSHRSTKSGKALEILGSYDSRRKGEAVIKEDRIKHWLDNGAQISATVNNFLIDRGVVKGNKRNVLSKKSVSVKKEEEKGEVKEKAREETPVDGKSEKSEEEAPIENETKE